jgi:tRNA-2-methylthio-N6-dimethylallyladenosine synthase
MKKLYVQTWGCQMNVYDSTRMTDVLSGVGYTTTEAMEDADLIVLNTCHIREKASEKLFSELGRLRVQAAETGRRPMIAVTGCVAQAEGAVIQERMPFVDIVVGPQSYHRLPELVALAARKSGTGLAVDFAAEEKFDTLPETNATQGPSAFLAVQEGCDKFCTFCVVPYTRGAEFSRAPAQILAEAERLVAGGAVEITLLGQNVNAWHGADEAGKSWGLGDLIRQLAEIPALQRIRYTTSHPRDMQDDLIEAHRDVPKLMPFLHLPVQSGSDRILAAMNRKHTAADYLKILDRLRAAKPDIGLSSDFIVGFPGETDQDFEDTLALVRAANYHQAYAFKYSPRPGTPAAALQTQIPEDVKDARLSKLLDLLTNSSKEKNSATISHTIEVLFDRPGRRAGQLLGRTPHMQVVHAEVPADFLGKIVPVRVVAATASSLSGEVA